MAVVIFDPANFIVVYPEFATVPVPRLDYFFQEATLILNNTDFSIVPYDPVNNVFIRAILLNMLTAHFAFLSGALSIEGLPAPVGRIAEAQEGSVQAQFQFNSPDSAQFFEQTQYGSQYWQAVLPYRTARYMPPPIQCNNLFGWWGGWWGW